MSREAWHAIKRSKRFYVGTYRRAGSAIVISAILNLVLELAIYHVYLNESESDFYATSGVTPPIPLTPMDSPNYTAYALLGSDSATSNDIKVIPK